MAVVVVGRGGWEARCADRRPCGDSGGWGMQVNFLGLAGGQVGPGGILRGRGAHSQARYSHETRSPRPRHASFSRATLRVRTTSNAEGRIQHCYIQCGLEGKYCTNTFNSATRALLQGNGLQKGIIALVQTERALQALKLRKVHQSPML